MPLFCAFIFFKVRQEDFLYCISNENDKLASEFFTVMGMENLLDLGLKNKPHFLMQYI